MWLFLAANLIINITIFLVAYILIIYYEPYILLKSMSGIYMWQVVVAKYVSM